MRNNITIIFFALILILFSSCKLNQISAGQDFKNNQIVNGNNNFIVNKPDNSKVYNNKEITEIINYHNTVVNIIEEKINYYNYLKTDIADKYERNVINEKKYNKQIEEANSNIQILEANKKKAKEVLQMWKELSEENEKKKNEYENKLKELEMLKSEVLKEKEELEKKRKAYEQEKNRYIPNNCYIITCKSDIALSFREKPVTKEEINALNSCKSTIYTNGDILYEAPLRSDCIIKKRLDESLLGFFSNGDVVDLIRQQGTWYEVVNIKTGEKGFISTKYGGMNTLTKTSCDKVREDLDKKNYIIPDDW